MRQKCFLNNKQKALISDIHTNMRTRKTVNIFALERSEAKNRNIQIEKTKKIEKKLNKEKKTPKKLFRKTKENPHKENRSHLWMQGKVAFNKKAQRDF